MRRILLFGVIAGLCAPATPVLAANCTLGTVAEGPIVMIGRRPTIATKINGADATLAVDSGSFWSMISHAAAAEYKLHTYPAPEGFRVEGLGGPVLASLAMVKELTVFNVPLPNREFFVGGSESGIGADGVLGQNILGSFDVEYDLANGVIRLMKPKGCEKSALAYWAGSKPFSMMGIDWPTPLHQFAEGTALLNGTKIRVLFDTGADSSFVSLRAATRAGVNTDESHVIATGYASGIGRERVKTVVVPVDNFTIGGEEIHNTRLRVGDSDLPVADMLVGADFFLSHRIYVANSQHKVYFTYNGGPVFNLSANPSGAQTADAKGTAITVGPDAGATAGIGPGSASGTNSDADLAAAAAAGGATTGSDTQVPPGEPADAAGFSRRGAAFLARRDFPHAIADLTRATQLNSSDSIYFYQRGVAYRENGQGDLAGGDFDQALKLKPEDVQTRIARAQLRMAKKDHEGAQSDLDAADQAAPMEADVRFRMGAMYGRLNELPSALKQFDLWIAVHREDSRMSDALTDRCLTRGLLSQELDKALSDCNSALWKRSGFPDALSARALVYLRMARYDKAVSDWDAVVKAEPRNAWALYARGVTKIRKGKASDGDTDIAAAKALRPGVMELGKLRGVTAP
jgi:tetratricopeptide (TPR) repeat protein